MLSEDFNDLQDDIFNAVKVIRKKKGHDYANEDTLSNFKVVSAVCKLFDIDPRRSATETSLFFEVVKLARKCNCKSKDPQNESLQDTVIDQINYACLTLGCMEDEKK